MQQDVDGISRPGRNAVPAMLNAAFIVLAIAVLFGSVLAVCICARAPRRRPGRSARCTG